MARRFSTRRGSGASGGAKLARAYEKLLADGALGPDGAQYGVLQKLVELADRLDAFQSQKTTLAAFFSRRQPAPKGIYVFGDVGRGKTMLMDLFFTQVNVKRKRRVHFHQFMNEVHQSIAVIRKNQSRYGKDFDPVALVAAPLIKKVTLLCFDEFHVNDITNAMLLGRLFEKFFAAGVVVVATSNVAPDGLYKNGLNRELFIPFVDMLKSRCEVVHLEAAKDYRLDKLSSQPVFFFGRAEQTRRKMDRLWSDLSDGLADRSDEIRLLGRTIKVPRTLKGMARFEFEDLCANPLGARDYLAVSHAFHLLAIDGVPRFCAANSNEAKRFILLIDTLYDQRVKLMASFATSLDGLSEDPDTAFEFRRCVSRLKEMASDAYLSAKQR
ncbi:ATPase [hydrothermal vent metagenome]|uniref:ATPase n=1 Tax=hydrothermal vent metagenome TaxID=652676 RepID=A0A3B0U6K6_9ZZZZ